MHGRPDPCTRRHNAYIRLANGYSSFPSPYDTALTPKAVVVRSLLGAFEFANRPQSLAGSFFKSCPDGSAPTIQPFPPATLSNATGAKIGSTISVAIDSSLNSGNQTLYCGFASNVQAAFSPYQNGQCTIPTANVTGGQASSFGCCGCSS
jgi:hypothetical protein